MRETLHLGTISRIRVGVHWSVVAIVVIIISTLGAETLRNAAPGFGGGAYWTAAVALAFLFLASLLAHELSHAVVARRRGLQVEGIVLWALGGVAKLEGDAGDARTELRVAVAGPATSLLLGGAFGLLALGVAKLGSSDLLVSALAWLAEMNVILGVFNMLPAYPLDGGRVLRAALWHRWDDQRRATDVSAAIGSTVGAAFMGLGLFSTLFAPALEYEGIWLTLIGWFILSTSHRERRALRASANLEGLAVRDVMTPVSEAAPAYATVNALVERHFRPGRLDCCPLVELSGSISGLVSLEQIGRLPAASWRETTAREIAWPVATLALLAPDEALGRAADALRQAPSHHGLVLDSGRVVGSLSPGDLERALRSPQVFRAAHGSLAAVHPAA